MPKFTNAPAAMNKMMEEVYANALKTYKGDKAKASQAAIAEAKKKYKKVGDKWIAKKVKPAEHSVPVGEHVVFRTGTHTTYKGEMIEYTEKHLDEMCETFSTEEDQQPAYIIGHSSEYPIKTAIPAFGRIKGGLKRIGKDLIAVGAEFSDVLADWVENGFYTERSAEICEENGKKKIFAIGMLGAVPPSVEGMPSILSALNNPAFAFSSNIGDVKEFSDSVDEEISVEDPIDVVEEQGKEATKKNVAECLAELQSSLEDMIDEEEDADRMVQKVYEHINDILSELRIHADFQKRLEQIEEGNEEEYSQHKGFWHEFAKKIKSIIPNRKDVDMEAKREQELLQTIADQKKQLDEFASQKAADKKAAEEFAITKEVKEFCDTAINGGKMTPAIRTKDEPIMVELAKTSPDALKAFREKYSMPLVPLGTVAGAEGATGKDSQKTIIELAKEYVEKHHAEFSSKMSDAEAVSLTYQRHVNGEINLSQTTK